MSESDTMFNERDRRCTAVQLMLSTDLSYDNRTIASTLTGLPRITPRVMKTKIPATVMVFGAGNIMPPHIFEVGLKVNTKVYLDELKCVVLLWCNQVTGCRPGCGSRTRHRPTSSKRPRLGFRRSATTLYPSNTAPSSPDLNSLDYFWVLRREHHQHDLPRHQSQPDRRHPLSICRAPAGPCGKGMLSVPDPYRGCDCD